MFFCELYSSYDFTLILCVCALIPFTTSGGRDPYGSILVENDTKKLSRRPAWLVVLHVFDKCHV